MSTTTETSVGRIVVCEDDQGVRESLGMVLQVQGHEVSLAETGEAAIGLITAEKPDLVVLDLNLPGIDGLEVCRRLRARGHGGPILMLTARHDVGDRVAGLDAGADDYLVKPFALEELLARVRAMIRRGGGTGTPVAPSTMTLDDLTIDTATRRVTRGEAEIDLTKIEFDLLELLVANKDIVMTRDVLYERIWGYDGDLSSNSLEVFVSAVRRKTEIDERPRLVHTVRGVGYVARIS